MARRYKLILLFLVLFSLFFSAILSWAEDEYYPYPIIFVHGVNSDASAWDTTIAELKQYFYNPDGSCKYFDYGGDYLIALDYEDQNNGDIPTIARTVLKPKIDETISKLPDGHKKVIIVAHSMGGLVTRSLLKQYPDYQDKIEKVVFVGTPHLGAPSASAISILKKLNETTLKDIAKEYSAFYSASLFTGFRFKPTNYSDYVFSRMAAKIITLKTNIGILLKAAKKCPLVPDTDGVAIGQLRVAGDVNYHTILADFSPFQFIQEDISLGHSGNETFLGQDNLANLSNCKVVRGVNTEEGRLLIKGVNFLLNSHSNNFTFPEGQSLGDAKDTGDGIVTKASQEGIAPADYTIDAFHTDEPNAVETILKALDDAPVIESVRAVPVDWEKTLHWKLKWWGNTSSPDFPPYNWIGNSNDYYVIIKVKDYLLADIEIESIALNGEPVTLPDNFKGQDENYKPYNAFKKDFLMSHEDTTTAYKDFNGNTSHINELQPGEFWVKLDLTDKNTVSIKVKNPAGLTTEKTLKISPSPTVSFIWEPTMTCDDNWNWCSGDISPFDIDTPPYQSYGSPITHQLTFSLKVQNSPVQRIRYNVFIEGREGIVKRLITQINDNTSGETLNLTDNVNGQSVYGKEFNDVITWYGEDDNGGYGYPLYVFYYISPIYYVNSHVMVEIIDDPTDDLLPLAVVTYSAPIGML